MAKKLISDLERFFQYIRIAENGCWEWQGAKDKDGYANSFSVGSARDGTVTRKRAQRFVYEELVGPIATGLVLDHVCRNRICVNPAHLEPVTPAENVNRSPFVRKAVCINGHDLDGVNLYVDPRGAHQCRTCRRDAIAKYRDKIGREAVNRYQREWDRMNRKREGWQRGGR